MCFLEPSTHICVAKESLLARKPTLKALLILTDASLGFIGTYIKKNQFLETLSVSVPAKGRGRECSSWGTLRLPWRFQAEGESTSVILGCSTKAFNQERAEEETALPSKEVSPISQETCYREQLLTHHCHLHPHLPPQKLLHACETEGGMQSPSPCPKHMHLLLHPFYIATTSRDKQRK